MSNEKAATGGAQKHAADFTSFAPPFLLWPVSRREFYRSICVALAPALAWGVILFGSRVLSMLVVGALAASFMYVLLKRVIQWRRARQLMYWHCLASALVLVALAHPSWPVWMVVALALLVPLALAVVGGPGKEPVHVAVAAVLAAQYLLLPVLGQRLHLYVGKADAVLARDRLVMGDIRNQAGDFPTSRRWPTWLDLAGDDAVTYPLPAVEAANALDAVAARLPTQGEAPGTAGGTQAGGGAGGKGADVMNPTDGTLRGILDRAFAYRLPRMDWFILGVAPNRVGAASGIALVLAGLYLAYRYILRPWSAVMFLAFFAMATALLAFTPAMVSRTGVWVIWEVLKRFPGEILTLFNYVLLNSDALFAGVIILALPGTQPLTVRGRWMFLLLAAVGAAALHRWDPAAPAATLTLCVLMPVAGVFDRVVVKRSWLNTRDCAKS